MDPAEPRPPPDSPPPSDDSDDDDDTTSGDEGDEEDEEDEEDDGAVRIRALPEEATMPLMVVLLRTLRTKMAKGWRSEIWLCAGALGALGPRFKYEGCCCAGRFVFLRCLRAINFSSCYLRVPWHLDIALVAFGQN